MFIVTVFLNLLLLIYIVTSCTYGPTQEKKSSLNYLNGEHYRSVVTGLGAPIVIERVEKNTVIKGECFFSKSDNFGQYEYPIKFQKILLNDDKITIGEATTDDKGRFVFTLPLVNGSYTLLIVGDGYRLEKKINITGYALDGVKIVINKYK